VPYLQFSDSPFFGGTFSYFHLETFEDGLANATGLTASGGAVIGPGNSVASIVDSVDGDDGAISGNCVSFTACFSYFAGIARFDFSAATLGSLPSHVGLVYTDGANPITVTFYDALGVPFAPIVGNHADGTVNNTTGEDGFYGFTDAGGISRVDITTPGSVEVDHVQYGLGEVANGNGTAVPEPGTLALIATGLLGYSLLRRRRTAKPA
jgi:hypothetical protein